jgi:hypothetical protein
MIANIPQRRSKLTDACYAHGSWRTGGAPFFPPACASRDGLEEPALASHRVGILQGRGIPMVCAQIDASDADEFQLPQCPSFNYECSVKRGY